MAGLKRKPGLTSIQVGVFAFIASLVFGAVILGLVISEYMRRINAAPAAVDPPVPTATLAPQPTATPTPTLTPTSTVTYTPTQTDTETPTPTDTETPTATYNFTPTSRPPTKIPSTKTQKPVSVTPKIESLELLNYYHLEGNVWMSLGDSSAGSMAETITQDWDKKSKASHTIMKIASGDDSGNILIEMVVIGNTVWVNMDGKWSRTDYPQPPPTTTGMEGLDTFFQDMKLKGEETVNGIPCKHYIVSGDASELLGQISGDVTMLINGEVWIANRSDLPQVLIRVKLHIQVTEGGSINLPLPADIPTPNASGPQEISMDFEYDVTKINVPVKIVAPE